MALTGTKLRFMLTKCGNLLKRPMSLRSCGINTKLFVPMVTNRSSNTSTWFSAHSNAQFCTKPAQEIELVDSVTYEKVCEETLESLCEYFEELVDSSPHLTSADINYGSGVLTINFGEPYGTYVINRQSPNRQIWLSSPTSGPKRYDYVMNGKYWIYRHDGCSLHQLLQQEIPKITNSDVNFAKCSYSKL